MFPAWNGAVCLSIELDTGEFSPTYILQPRRFLMMMMMMMMMDRHVD
jgi:hypothetical protein